jgi:uncharacterized protein YciI
MKKILTCVLILSVLPLVTYGQYTFVFLHKKSDSEKIPEEQVKKIMEGHMANMERLHKEGKLLAAGPFEGGGGLFVLNTNNRSEAESWLSKDPGVQAKRWNIEILPYSPRYGGICPVGEKYEMTNYLFVRFTPVEGRFSANMIDDHDHYLKTLTEESNVITEGIFAEGAGGIIILKPESDTSFKADPAIQQGALTTDVKKLFIAKGSFCEK